jgi:hypothetical protein
MGIPTLVVGLGGTGVLTLRALKQLYEKLPERERVPALFLAYDFDRAAMMTGDEKSGFARLEENREFLYLNTKGIQDFLRNLDQSKRGGLAWEKILRWFPDRSSVRIPSSEVEANGASQLRCLGRLRLFLNDELIEGSLRRALLGLEMDPRNLSDDKRVILVSSVAGGTGSGMLIDMAYLARRQEIRPSVWAYLLLPEVFEDVDSGSRIFMNSYACLKELAYLKEQAIPFEAQYVRIPPVEVSVGEEEPFQRIFLTRGELHSGADAVKRASVQIAEVILAQLQRDIQGKCLSIASGGPSNHASHEEQKRTMGVFGTASSSLIELAQVNALEKLPIRRLQHFFGGYKLERKELEDQLLLDIFRRRQRVFGKRSAGTESEGFALVMLPPRSPWSSREHADLEVAISKLLKSRVLVESYAGTGLWVYFEDIFYSLGDVKNVNKYFQSYKQLQYKELVHIDRRMLEDPIFRDVHRMQGFPLNIANYLGSIFSKVDPIHGPSHSRVFSHLEENSPRLPAAESFVDRERHSGDVQESGKTPGIDISPQLLKDNEKAKEIFISYAWGDDTPEGKIRTQAVDGLYAALEKDGFRPVRDRDQMHGGDRISAFISQLTRADLVVAVISEKYLRSTYCMFEIYKLWQRSQGDPDVLSKILVPIVLPEVKIKDVWERLPYIDYWRAEAERVGELERSGRVLSLSPETFQELRLVREFTHHVDGILVFIQDVLMPRRLEVHLDDGFQAVRDAVRRRANFQDS